VGTAANDVLIVGAGLGGGLIALALTQLRPELRVTLLERGRELGGNHTWCFHAADCPEAARELVAPLLAARWPGYSVRFPGRRRRLASPYACITSDRLDQALVAAARRTRLQLEREAEVVHVAADAVELADGRRLTAPLVIDARGPAQRRDSSVAFQKFVGLELQVAPGHAIAEPILIDACVPQRDGFRFMYVLPLAPDRVLVEDTYYAERPDLDDGALEHGILDYAEGLGLGVTGPSPRRCRSWVRARSAPAMRAGSFIR